MENKIGPVKLILLLVIITIGIIAVVYLAYSNNMTENNNTLEGKYAEGWTVRVEEYPSKIQDVWRLVLGLNENSTEGIYYYMIYDKGLHAPPEGDHFRFYYRNETKIPECECNAMNIYKIEDL